MRKKGQAWTKVVGQKQRRGNFWRRNKILSFWKTAQVCSHKKDKKKGGIESNFATAYKLILPPTTINPSGECQFRVFLKLDDKDRELFNERSGDCEVQVLIRIGEEAGGGDGSRVLWDKMPENYLVKMARCIVGGYSSPIEVGRWLRKWPAKGQLQVDLSWSPLARGRWQVRAELVVVQHPAGLGAYLGAKAEGAGAGATRPPHHLPSELSLVSEEVSLTCPLTMRRMSLPARGQDCPHLACFDAASYLSLNLAGPKWTCPHCRAFVFPSSLTLDPIFLRLLDHCPDDIALVHFDGSVFRSAQSVSTSADNEQTFITL